MDGSSTQLHIPRPPASDTAAAAFCAAPRQQAGPLSHTHQQGAQSGNGDVPSRCPATQLRARDRVALTLTAQLTAQLRKLGWQNGATLFATVLSGWAVLLGR